MSKNTLKTAAPFRVGRLATDPSSADNGTIIYNTTDNKFKIYESSIWQAMADESYVDQQISTLQSNLSSFSLQNAYQQDSDGGGATITTTSADGNLIIAGTEGLVVTGAAGLTVGSSSQFAVTNAGDVKLAANISRYSGVSDFVKDSYTVLTLSDATVTVASSLNFLTADFNASLISYKIEEDTTKKVRVGTLFVATDGSSTSVADNYAETADLGVDWSASIANGYCRLTYSCSSTGYNRIMKADRKLFQAEGYGGIQPSLLMTMEGASFVDLSPNAYAVTSNNGAVLSSAQAAFGGKSASFPNSTSSLTLSAAAAPSGLEDFTIECWVYLTANNVGYQFFCTNPGTADQFGGWVWLLETNNTLTFLSTSGVGWDTFLSSSYQPPINQWLHLAVVRQGSSFRMYANGNKVSETTSGNQVNNPGINLMIGNYTHVGGANAVRGYIDNLRIIKGQALYSGNTYTIPGDFT